MGGVNSSFGRSEYACDKKNSRTSVAYNLADNTPERDSQGEYYKLHLALSIYAQESLGPITPQRGVLMAAVTRQFSEAPVIEREIVEIQRRLGTPDERSGDMERAKKAAHQLANMMCTALLLRDMGNDG